VYSDRAPRPKTDVPLAWRGASIRCGWPCESRRGSNWRGDLTRVAAHIVVESREETSELASVVHLPIVEETCDAFPAGELHRAHLPTTLRRKADQADASVIGSGAPRDELRRFHGGDLSGDGGGVEAEDRRETVDADGPNRVEGPGHEVAGAIEVPVELRSSVHALEGSREHRQLALDEIEPVVLVGGEPSDAGAGLPFRLHRLYRTGDSSCMIQIV